MRMVEQALKAYREAAQAAQSWPFEEARRVLTRTKGKVPEKGYILLETGYGPSGLPHIGTFGEVARTVMVQHALQTLSDIPTRLFCFSDDVDGLRKVPDNVPHPEWLQEHLGQPLTEVPDPYEKYPSFGEHNNAMLQEFLDSFGFRYEFQSATQHYKAGDFDAMLLNVLRHYDEIMALILPTLRDERRVTYSPFLPICPTTHQVLQVAMEAVDPDAGTVTYRDPTTGRLVEVPVTGVRASCSGKSTGADAGLCSGSIMKCSGKTSFRRTSCRVRFARSLAAVPGAPFLRAVPGPKWSENFQIQRQWPDHPGVAEIRPAREPCLLYVPGTAQGQTVVF